MIDTDASLSARFELVYLVSEIFDLSVKVLVELFQLVDSASSVFLEVFLNAELPHCDLVSVAELIVVSFERVLVV